MTGFNCAQAPGLAAHRHRVRQQAADKVTWLWTVNVIDTQAGIPSPAPGGPAVRM